MTYDRRAPGVFMLAASARARYLHHMAKRTYISRSMNTHVGDGTVRIVAFKEGVGKTINSLSLGLSQAVGFGMVKPPSVVHHRNATESMRRDWVKVGADMRRGIDVVGGRGKR